MARTKASVKRRLVFKAAVDIIRSRNPAMFKPSPRCRAPHVNAELLLHKLLCAPVLNENHFTQFTHVGALVSWLEACNEAEGLVNRDKKGGLTEMMALAKATRHGFWLGLRWSWLER